MHGRCGETLRHDSSSDVRDGHEQSHASPGPPHWGRSPPSFGDERCENDLLHRGWGASWGAIGHGDDHTCATEHSDDHTCATGWRSRGRSPCIWHDPWSTHARSRHGGGRRPRHGHRVPCMRSILRQRTIRSTHRHGPQRARPGLAASVPGPCDTMTRRGTAMLQCAPAETTPPVASTDLGSPVAIRAAAVRQRFGRAFSAESPVPHRSDSSSAGRHHRPA